MKTIKGDLIKLALQGEFDAIVHGCNCHNVMEAGIAAQIKRYFPAAYQADEVFADGISNYNKLGCLSFADIEVHGDEDDITTVTERFTVVNAYTQYDLGRNLDEDALIMCLKKINHYYKGKSVGLPQIGCGIAGGNWAVVSQLIDKYTPDCDVTVVMYDPK